MFDHLEIDPVLFWPIVTGAVGLLIGLPVGRRLLGARERRLLAQQAAEGTAFLAAMNALIAGDKDKTIETLLGVVRENTDGVEPYLALGRLLRERGDAARSLRLHQHLLVRPGLHEAARRRALFALGQDLRALGDSERARRALERAVRVLKKDASVVRELAEVCEGQRDWAIAVALRKREGKLAGKPSRPVRAHLLAEWGHDVAKRGQPRRARRILKKAVGFAPDALHPRLGYADLLFTSGDLRAAAENYERAIMTRSPLRGYVIPKLEEAYFQLGDFNRLETFLRKAIGERPKDEVLQFALARFLMRKGEHDEAVITLRALIAGRPDLREAHRELGAWLLANGEADAVRGGYDGLLAAIDRSLAGFWCERCRRTSREVEWRCGRCGAWEAQRSQAVVGSAAVRDASPPVGEVTPRLAAGTI